MPDACGWRVQRRWRLFEHQVRVGAAKAEGADSSASRFPTRRPIGQSGADVKRGLVQIEVRVRALEVKAGGDLLGSQRKDDLEQTRHARGDVQVADICLRRADRAEAVLVGESLERTI